MIAWDSPGGFYSTPVGLRDVTSFDVLSFRVTQRFASSRNPLGVKDFTVRLVDKGGKSADVSVGSIATITFPYERRLHKVPNPSPPPADIILDHKCLTKSALKTIRIPLTEFTDLEPLLKLNEVRRIVFRFDKSPRGEIAIDDIEFSK